MQLIYEGKDIAAAVEIRKVDLTDNAGGELDSLELHFNDPKGLWSQWQPEKNHTVQVQESGFDSGIMNVDEIRQQRGLIVVKALPIKQEAKTENTRAWDNARLLGMAQELATKNGLTLQSYGVQDQLYARVDQLEQSDPAFLAWRCLLEGIALKITDQKLVIFNELYMESQTPAKTLTPGLMDGDFLFKNKSNQIFGACRITYGDIQYEFTAPNTYGPTLKYTDVSVSNQDEARRFSRGLLRGKNRYEQTFFGALKLDTGVAAGTTFKLAGFGLADGNYLAYQVVHKLVEKKTILRLRKPLEGY